MGSDLLFFTVIILIFFGLWLMGGGPNKPISFAGPYITPITNVGVTQSGYGDQINTSYSFGAHISSPSSIEHGLSNAYDSFLDLQKKVQDLKLYGEPSVYEGKVTLSRGAFTDKVETEYVNLSVSRSAGSDIDITGWKLVSVATGNWATIGRGAIIPQTGSVNTTSDIVLHPGDHATLATKESPIGISFRENECTGYLNQYQDFVPNLPNECPDPVEEFNRFYTGNPLSDDRCYDLMKSSDRCRVPRDSDRLTSACYTLIDTRLNYNGCVSSHRYDPNFAGDTWHIYFERDEDEDALWKQSREAIKLVDSSGKTVDVLQY